MPTSTGAAKGIGEVLPELTGKLDGYALRVPVPSASVVDLTVEFRSRRAPKTSTPRSRPPPREAQGHYEVLRRTDRLRDIVADPHSSIFDSPLTKVIGSQAKVVSWYDNELATRPGSLTSSRWSESRWSDDRPAEISTTFWRKGFRDVSARARGLQRPPRLDDPPHHRPWSHQKASAPTLSALAEAGAKVVVAAHPRPPRGGDDRSEASPRCDNTCCGGTRRRAWPECPIGRRRSSGPDALADRRV